MSVYKPQIEDRVCYSARFIRSVQGDELADRVGTVRDIRTAGRRTVVAWIEWDDAPGELSGALPVNIARAGSWRAVDASATR